jgi:hypothetical protein
MRLAPIAAVTWRQAMRDRVLRVLGGGACVGIAVSKAIGWVTPAEDLKVMTDLTLATLAALAVLAAVLLGARLVRDDLERRTLHTVCAKDVSRGEVLLGKYLGLLGALALGLGLAGALAAAYLALMGATVGAAFGAALCGIGLQVAVVLAAALFFSTCSSPVLTVVATLAVFVIGTNLGWLDDFRRVWPSGWARTGTTLLWYGLPNLGHANFLAEASHGLPVPLARFALGCGSCAAWAAAFLAGAWAVFRGKEL